jgi:hypothetical protein
MHVIVKKKITNARKCVLIYKKNFLYYKDLASENAKVHVYIYGA